ncbi:MAG TPA: hypothetical protein VEQ63_03865 [Bryobacteraceae bacterium]|nr:hypothetical protein [Bryobacteraceae bacterium]
MLKGRFVASLALIVCATVLQAGDGSGRRIRLGGISASGGYLSGGGWWPYSGYYGGYPFWGGGFNPLWSYPYLHPGIMSGFGYAPNMGEVKIAVPDPDAAVYLDDAYAGPARKLKSMWLEPGVYKLALKDSAGKSYERKIYVLTGKRLDIRADLRDTPKEAAK